MKVTVSVPRLGQVAEPGGHPIVITADGRRLQTPPVEHLVFYLTLGIFAAAEVIEWPVALALSAGHILTGLTSRPGLSELGQGLEAA
jgi:hypothetical protein